MNSAIWFQYVSILAHERDRSNEIQDQETPLQNGTKAGGGTEDGAHQGLKAIRWASLSNTNIFRLWMRNLPNIVDIFRIIQICLNHIEILWRTLIILKSIEGAHAVLGKGQGEVSYFNAFAILCYLLYPIVTFEAKETCCLLISKLTVHPWAPSTSVNSERFKLLKAFIMAK